MRLYTYWRSTASYRARIALELKHIEADQDFVHLVRDGGQHRSPGYLAINPQGRVPALKLDNGSVITQSLAILEYLEELHPSPPLLPADPEQRAKVRAVAATICCDIHPLHNVGPLNYLRNDLGCSEAQVSGWIENWMKQGLQAVECLISSAGFCFGPDPGLADVCLIPQLYAARRFNVLLDSCPKLLRVEQLAGEHEAFRRAHPARQADAV